MKSGDVRSFWSFDAPVADDSEIHCHECGEWSLLAEWERGYVDCDTCGDHDAMVCPKCDEHYDHVHSSHHPLRVRRPEID